MPNWTKELLSPPWPKSHDVKLAPADVYDAAQKAGGRDTIERHRPLSIADHYGDRSRRAGTNSVSRSTETLSHQTAADYGGSDDDPSGWRKRLADPNAVVSVRDVKKATPEYVFALLFNHAFARYVLPAAESEIKGQQWPGKKMPDEKKEDDTDKPQSTEEEGTSKEDKENDEEKQQGPKLTAEQQAFLDKLFEEMRQVESFKNNPGQPQGELKILDADAAKQLESHLSIDDQTTPDSWIPRSLGLLRLTGKHPFNAEPNLVDLYDAGMITPTKVHYCRSHGSVPQLTWEMHKLSVFSEPEGLIACPKDWTMDEIAFGGFRTVEIPVTFGCDGNRRKELNMIKKTSAFNYTAAAVSTSLWRGVMVRDLILASGLQDQPDDERWYLHFEGADAPSEGPYATSMPLMHAMNPANDVMLVFGQNGRVLHPDHGYPLRIIIPGWVGGRQVKWLKKLWVAKKPNRSHYHIWDNRLLPSMIDSRDHPFGSAFYHHESTECNEQCLQSVIVKPAHDELIPLDEGNLDERTYTVEGFAFNGAGDRVERIELSLDGGATWKYCFRRFWDKPLRHGEKYWAWVFWSCELKLEEMIGAQEISLRSMDSRKNYQPEHTSWNLMGMMNNAWYRLKPKITTHPETHRPVVQFQHPVAPGNVDGGWMQPPKEQQDEGNNGAKDMKEYSLEEVMKHDNENDAWLIIDNKVYDVTSVLSWHPGGAKAISAYAGKATVDVTNEYKGIHDNYAHSKRDECLIGVLSPEGVKTMNEDAVRAAKELAKIKSERKDKALQPDVFTQAKLVKKHAESHDTQLYTFELPKREDGSHGLLGLPVGKHVLITVHFKDQAVLRPYTPTRPVLPEEEDGTFDLLVKTYLPTDDGPFPPGGTVSNYLDCMEEGEEIDIRGPGGGIMYKGHGEFDIDGEQYHFDKVNLVAGGSGLTPHWQFIHAVLSDKSDKTKIVLLDSNKSPSDILMRDALAKYSEEEPERFKLVHILSEEPNEDVGAPYVVGRLNKEIMEEHFYPAAEGAGTLLCGPPGLVEKGALPGLKEMGFKEGEGVFGY
ncbi:hypothetical protein DICSQDRAFT_101612 [Dichomitus squalens LYAD-421 SS1]|uniref:uncharacterized protein n=1 Tax=Dichomitus squalens (strain LYAD-421) TaxID=732165 RepID=UPI0004410CC5|nr:uncharacterized protein DICSQDRAFT_101612 [Dichomitus squalens LYAD-421 SS1]EJF63681.1 hypothetical protein DICSQDRAFT_101612 [Dichomitus squalens LYAD-421 SS1]